MTSIKTAGFAGDTLEIIAFRLHEQEFCVKTTTIREIRGWAPSTPIPHSPPDVIGVMNLRGTVIPIIDLAHKLGMKSTEANERSAIVVAEVHSMVVGLVVDSLVFLHLAFGSLDFLAGQIIGKAWMVLLALPLMHLLRRRDERLGLVAA